MPLPLYERCITSARKVTSIRLPIALITELADEAEKQKTSSRSIIEAVLINHLSDATIHLPKHLMDRISQEARKRKSTSPEILEDIVMDYFKKNSKR